MRSARHDSALRLGKYLIRLKTQHQVRTKVKEFFGTLEKFRQACLLRIKTKKESVKIAVQKQVEQAVKKVRKEVMQPKKKNGNPKTDHPFKKAILDIDIVLMEQTI